MALAATTEVVTVSVGLRKSLSSFVELFGTLRPLCSVVGGHCSALATMSVQGARSLPRLVYGTAWKKEHTSRFVLQALQEGFRAVDTASQPKHYQEKLVGGAISEAIEKGIITREDLFLQTKFTPIDGQDRSKPLPYDPQQTYGVQVRTCACIPPAVVVASLR